MLSIKPKIFNISVGSSFKNLVSSLLLHFSQTIQRINVPLKMHGISRVLSFLGLLDLIQQIYDFGIFENIQVLFYNFYQMIW